MIRPTNRYKYDEQEHIKYVLDDLDSADLILDDMILDNPKRAIVRCAKNHAALYACEYCKHKAQYCADHKQKSDKVNNNQEHCIKEQIEILKSKPGTTATKLKDDKNIQ